MAARESVRPISCQPCTEPRLTRPDKTFRAPQTQLPGLQELYSDVWRRIDPDAIIASEQSIQGALNLARTIGEQRNGMQTLVTGSLHLVGGALNLLRPLG